MTYKAKYVKFAEPDGKKGWIVKDPKRWIRKDTQFWCAHNDNPKTLAVLVDEGAEILLPIKDVLRLLKKCGHIKEG